MVDVISKKCNFEGCTKHPSFGVEGTRNREYCAKHAPEGMIILGKAGRPKQIPTDRKRRASTGVGADAGAARYVMFLHVCLRLACFPFSVPPSLLYGFFFRVCARGAGLYGCREFAVFSCPPPLW